MFRVEIRDEARETDARDRQRAAPTARVCGECSLCCTLLRVDELAKLGGTPCLHQRTGGGCSIHPRRPAICRAYRCLWLKGGLREEDRPDRLGALLDLVPRGGGVELAIREATPGAYERSPRLREIAAEFRRSMPVRISDVVDVMDPARAQRLLLPDGGEQRIAGEWTESYVDGRRVERRRLPWLDRLLRGLQLRVAARRLRHHRR